MNNTSFFPEIREISREISQNRQCVDPCSDSQGCSNLLHYAQTWCSRRIFGWLRYLKCSWWSVVVINSFEVICVMKFAEISEISYVVTRGARASWTHSVKAHECCSELEDLIWHLVWWVGCLINHYMWLVMMSVSWNFSEISPISQKNDVSFTPRAVDRFKLFQGLC